MTSNLGVKKLQDFGSGIGFQKKDYVVEEQKRDVLKKELQKFFAPEFLNRIDDIIVFNTLKEEHVKEIVKIELIKLTDRLTKIKYNFKFDDSIIDMISKVGFDEMYGARTLKRAIQDKIEDYISEEVLRGELLTGVNYVVSSENEVITITEDKKPKKGKSKKEVE
jgi:ATP-dependent Clp protease ATP-binding subunit ClpC